MTVSILPVFTSAIPDDAAATAAGQVTPTRWNQGSTLTMATASILGRTTAGTGAAEELTAAQTKTLLSLQNVDNTSDANKPVSTAQATAIAAKQDTLISGTNIKTVNGVTLLGSGDLAVAVPSYTWAGKPAAASFTGHIIRISDAGVGPGLLVISDGTRWVPDGVQVLARSAVAVSGAADTNENALATIAVPVDLMGVNGSIRVTAVYSHNNNANNKTFRIRHGTSATGGTAFWQQVATTVINHRTMIEFRNRNATGSQVGFATGTAYGDSGGTLVTGAIDTTLAANVYITATKANAGDTVTLEQYSVEVLP